jgi:signal peptidase I
MQEYIHLAKIKADIFKKALSSEKSIQIRVFGSCMWPFLKNGEYIVINPANLKDICIGEIVLTYKEGNLLCHRVVIKKSDFIQTKADTFLRLDPPISEKDLIGKVVARKLQDKTVRIDGWFCHYVGFLASRFSLAVNCFYSILFFLKKVWVNSIKKLSYT